MRQAYRERVVVVLGAGGFIGRHVALKLVGMGAQVYGTHRPGKGQPEAKGLFKGLASVKWQALDLLDGSALQAWLGGIQPDIIFNLAGYGVWRDQRSPSLFEGLNDALVGQLLFYLEKMPGQNWPGQRLIHVGSAQEYGQLPGDLREAGPAQPTTEYGRTKLRGTQRVIAAHAKGMAVLCARLFTVYGPGAQDDKLLPLLRAARTTQDRIPLSHGLQKRDFTYVEEVAEGLLRLGMIQKGPPVVNLATGALDSVRDFIEIARRHLDIPVERLAFGDLPTRVDEMEHLPVNISRLESLTAWKPALALEEGLRYACIREGDYA